MRYSLYFHTPFCKSRCRYCDFYTIPASSSVPDEYVDALIRDFKRYAPKDDEGKTISPATVYFGGGTPGLLTPKQVEKILSTVKPQTDAEITLEANPESTTYSALCGFRAAGVNRLSLGVQTSSNESLKCLGRLHTREVAVAALNAAIKAKYENISCDIMLSLPNYTNAEFDDTLKLVHEGGAKHMSAYMLKIEDNTAFGKKRPAGLPGDDASADFYLYAAQRLKEHGYERYEISNFAVKGYESKHNLVYWQAGNWLGLGPCAHSHMQGKRFSFAGDTKAFLRDELPVHNETDVTAEDYIMLRLRLTEGLCEDELQSRWGVTLHKKQKELFENLCRAGYAKKLVRGWALTGRGMLVQNSILAQLFAC